MRERVQKAKGVVDEAVQRRKQEIKEQQQQQEATKQAAAAVRPEIQKALQLWRRPKNWQRDRDIGELLSSLHTIVCSVTAEMIVGDKVLTAQSPAADIKKAYLRAARQIHPDKFTGKRSTTAMSVVPACLSLFLVVSPLQRRWFWRSD